MVNRWISMWGDFEERRGEIIFKSKAQEVEGGGQPAWGHYVSDHTFYEGSIEADVRFAKVNSLSACALALSFDPENKFILTAGLAALDWAAFAVSQRAETWRHIAIAGDRTSLRSEVTYHIAAGLAGSRIELSVNGVTVIRTNLPFSLNQGQAGIWCQGESDISIKNFTIKGQGPKAFVAMQYAPPYDELYVEVLKVVCDEFGLITERSDESYRPGLIISDIVNQIQEARVVIADVSSLNPNVFYEVGYAHALGKPNILLAQKDTKLPFDISGSRHILYENTIAGKAKVEERLRGHLRALGFSEGKTDRGSRGRKSQPAGR